MSPILFEVLVIISLVAINGLLALAEIAIVASRKPRLQRIAEKGNQRAMTALQLAESPADFLSTVQVGITLVGVLSGAFAGATIAEQLALGLAVFPGMAAYAETIALAAVVVAITYLTLIFGELVPKRIALNNPERVGALVARPMRLISKLTSPAVRLLSISSDVVLRLLRVRPSGEPSVTQDEVRIMIRQGTIAGVFGKDQQEMIDRVFRLGSLRLTAIMTPRGDIVPLYTADTVDLVAEKLKRQSHTHYPLCEDNLDNVLGVVSTADMLVDALAKRSFDLRACVRVVPSMPESVSALKALELMKKSGAQVGLVIDEFGGLQGMVTMDDFGGAIVGLVPDAGTPKIVQRKDGSILVDGLLPIADLQEALGLPELSLEESQSYTTVGGFVLARMGRIPSAGDVFQIGDYRFEILDMDGLRIDKVLIIRFAQMGEQGG
jgi:magnesium and cobalt exporter, CNNM family